MRLWHSGGGQHKLRLSRRSRYTREHIYIFICEMFALPWLDYICVAEIAGTKHFRVSFALLYGL